MSEIIRSLLLKAPKILGLPRGIGPSQPRPRGTEFLDAETDGQKPLFRRVETDTETGVNSKSPRSAGQMHGFPAEFDTYRLGGELDRDRTYDPLLIEPAFGTQVRSKILMRRRAGETALSSHGDRYGNEGQQKTVRYTVEVEIYGMGGERTGLDYETGGYYALCAGCVQKPN